VAFTPAEKAAILFYLGYSGFEDDGPAMRAVNSLDSKESTMGPFVRDTLDKLRVMDEEIFATRPLAKATQDGSIQLRVHYTMAHLVNMARQYVTRLARWTKIAVQGDVFGQGSERLTGAEFYSGDPSEHRINPDVGAPTLGDFRKPY